jgi:hypothetical protein
MVLPVDSSQMVTCPPFQSGDPKATRLPSFDRAMDCDKKDFQWLLSEDRGQPIPVHGTDVLGFFAVEQAHKQPQTPVQICVELA